MSNPNNQENAISINNCIQRRLYFTFMSGAVYGKKRVEVVSPYPGNTKEQLDMRRKAEILQYKSATYVLSKKQTWANMVKFGNNMQPCTETQIIQVPTSSSDVPGPVILLYNDQSIPLYNYSPGINQLIKYPLVEFPQLLEPWNAFPIGDVIIKDGNSNAIANLIIVSPNSNKYKFAMNFPVAITISGIANLTSSSSTKTTHLNLNIAKIECDIYYGTVIITTKTLDTNPLGYLTVDVENSVGKFYASAYVGNLTIDNINLLTITQYVYTFKFRFYINDTAYDADGNVISSYTDNINKIEIETICNLSNISDPYYYQATNCIITYPPDYSPFPKFSMTGRQLNA